MSLVRIIMGRRRMICIVNGGEKSADDVDNKRVLVPLSTLVAARFRSTEPERVLKCNIVVISGALVALYIVALLSFRL